MKKTVMFAAALFLLSACRGQTPVAAHGVACIVENSAGVFFNVLERAEDCDLHMGRKPAVWVDWMRSEPRPTQPGDFDAKVKKYWVFEGDAGTPTLSAADPVQGTLHYELIPDAADQGRKGRAKASFDLTHKGEHIRGELPAIVVNGGD